MQVTLFDDGNGNGATFSADRKYRFSLWRQWDKLFPWILFIGLNPSTANESENDPTIRKVIKIAKYNGFGGVCMLNCFAFVSTDPNLLNTDDHMEANNRNNITLISIGRQCREIVFAWGNFPVVSETGRDQELKIMFPGAKALHINKNGSPKHPLYCKDNSKLIPFN